MPKGRQSNEVSATIPRGSACVIVRRQNRGRVQEARDVRVSNEEMNQPERNRYRSRANTGTNNTGTRRSKNKPSRGAGKKTPRARERERGWNVDWVTRHVEQGNDHIRADAMKPERNSTLDTSSMRKSPQQSRGQGSGPTLSASFKIAVTQPRTKRPTTSLSLLFPAIVSLTSQFFPIRHRCDQRIEAMKTNEDSSIVLASPLDLAFYAGPSRVGGI